MSKINTSPPHIFQPEYRPRRVEVNPISDPPPIKQKSSYHETYPINHLLKKTQQIQEPLPQLEAAHTHFKFGKIKKQIEQAQCPICLTSALKTMMIQFSPNCPHYSCNPCLQQHIKHQLKNFKTIKCLSYKCEKTVDENSEVYRKMSIDQKEKYYKILIRNEVNKHPNRRVCPNDGCQGYIVTNEIPVICVICGQQFCPKCSLNKHVGECDQNGVNYLVNNLMFKKCERCKMVVQKAQGCYHMTCRCGYQFCYLCGQMWLQNHVCNQRIPPHQSPNNHSIQLSNVMRTVFGRIRSQPLQQPNIQIQRIERSRAEVAASQANLAIRGQQIQARQNIPPGQNANDQIGGVFEQSSNCKYFYLLLFPLDLLLILSRLTFLIFCLIGLTLASILKATFYTSFKVIATQFGKLTQCDCMTALKIAILVSWVPAWIYSIKQQFIQLATPCPQNCAQRLFVLHFWKMVGCDQG